jgi:hypothetical protein
MSGLTKDSRYKACKYCGSRVFPPETTADTSELCKKGHLITPNTDMTGAEYVVTSMWLPEEADND